MATRLKHRCHAKNGLILRELSGNSFFQCALCDLHFNGPAYCCWECNIVLHKSCAELPPKTGHPAHPCIRVCARNKMMCSDYDDCYFSLDVAVAALTLYYLKEEEEKEKIQHFAHDHPLTPFSLDVSAKAECRVCGEMISGSIYGCPACSLCKKI